MITILLLIAYLLTCMLIGKIISLRLKPKKIDKGHTH